MGRLKERVRKEREEQIDLAINHYRKSNEPSIRASAEKYDLPYSTLRDRLAGSTTRRESHHHQQLLTDYEEKSIVQWILRMDDWGFPPRLCVVKELAQHLVGARISGRKLGKHWLTRFLDRNPEINSKLAVRLDRQRALADNPTTLKDYFTKVSRETNLVYMYV